MNEPVIVLDRLSKSFGDVHAVQNLSLTIAPGSIFGFLGPNGAGTTTTMRMLCGLTHPTSGKAAIGGADAWKDRQLVRTKFGYVPQRFSLYRDLTVLENLRFFGGAYGVPGAELQRRIERLCTIHRSFFLMNRQQVLILFTGNKSGICSTISVTREKRSLSRRITWT